MKKVLVGVGLIALMAVLVSFERKDLPVKRIPLAKGVIESIDSFPSKFVASRRVDVWLPKGYNPEESKKYSVLYMHDGQNLFIPGLSYSGSEWMVDETLSDLMDKGLIADCIVVGIWNTPKRFMEYAPAKPFALFPDSLKAKIVAERGGEALSDSYLKFIVKELKPYIDRHYKTLRNYKNTTIMGSSMGGLISLYAICEYPKVFGQAGCVSTHWPYSLKTNSSYASLFMVKYLQQALPTDGKHKIYFDYGTGTLDSLYEPHQHRIDSLMVAKGYTSATWITRKFEGAFHSETSWQKRLDIPVKFLMGKK